MTLKPTAEAISDRLSSLHSLEDVRGLLAVLGFPYRDELLPTKALPVEIGKALAEPPRIIAAVQNFLVGFVQLKAADAKDIDRHMIRLQRQMISKLPDQYQEASLLVFASDGFERVHFVNAKRVGKRLILRRFLTGGEHKTRTAAERMQHLCLVGSEDYQQVLKLADDAFNRDAVTEKFFKSFETVFKAGKKELVSQIKDEHAAHQFLHSLLNRLMFIYFVQRKGWLADGDAEFIKTLWEMYLEERDAKRVELDSFYSDWLATLFFSAFNNKHGYEHKGLPQQVVSWFKMAPYLDGGLFMKSSYDGMGFAVPDAMFERIFEDILNAYNFTVTEDTPFDQNIAVDPEMLGIVYESLVNTTELSDEKAGAGIFYTPRVEVDFMCRRALVEHIAKHATVSREDVYRFVFPEDGDEAPIPWKASECKEVDAALLDLKVVDPACGSGAFLVGMMQVIVELRKALWPLRGMKGGWDEFKQRRDTIERSLYGVDVKDWAISIAQLRLWLTLIEIADDKELPLAEMKMANEPLLPKLGFRLRVGDSLVQEIAGTTIPLRSAKGKLSPAIQRRVTELRKLKTDYYFNRGDLSEKHIKNKELEVYGAILDEKRKVIRDEIARVEQSSKAAFQQDLLAHLAGEAASQDAYSEHQGKEDEKRKSALTALHEELRKLDSIHNSLPKKQRLFWSIEFAEVFQESGGFDVVIGNPPYVRQEKIADPFLLEAGKAPDVEENRVYKEKLSQMLHDDWGSIVRGKPVAGANIGKRADLYVYFYMRGLALTREGGVFVFITSNSWLDVGYGAGLQEFLLKRARVLAIYDNQTKRSFKNAEVNTIIAVIEPLPISAKPDGTHLARFVMFKQPFEEAVSSDTLTALEAATGRDTLKRKHEDAALARVVPIEQSALYKSGTPSEDDEVDGESTKRLKLETYSQPYSGNKWGGKYLRAPDIYWTILEKGKGKLVRLGDIADVRRGFTTGANEFFYLEPAVPHGAAVAGCEFVKNSGKEKNGKSWEGWIESECLKPVIKSPREYYSPMIHGSTTLQFLARSAELPEYAARYVKWAESKGIHLTPSCRGRKPWYVLKGPMSPKLLWPSAFFERHIVYECPTGYVADKVFYTISGNKSGSLSAYLNSTVVSMLVEAEGYQLNHGGIFVTTDWLADLPVLAAPNQQMVAAYEALAEREIRLCADELKQPSRRVLDEACFTALGVEPSLVDDMYDYVNRHVAGRIHKANRGVTKSGREMDD